MGEKVISWLDRHIQTMELAISPDGCSKCFLLHDVDICALFHKC